MRNLHQIRSFAVAQLPEFQEADLIIYHNLHGDFFSYLAVPRLLKLKPSILFMHDMWAITGHCGYSLDCTRRQNGCGICPYLDVEPAIRFDNTRLEWRLKRWMFDQPNLTIVSPSHWLSDLISRSHLASLPCRVIPNGVDLEVFRPLDRGFCRASLGIDPAEKVILFGALALNEERKGVSDAIEVVRKLVAQGIPTVVISFGWFGPNPDLFGGAKVLSLGYVQSDELKNVALNAADIMAFPSKADNFPLTVLESIAAGLPVVAYDVGGLGELLVDDRVGVLNQTGDVAGLYESIFALLADTERLDKMRVTCRGIVEERFDIRIVGGQLMGLCREIVST